MHFARLVHASLPFVLSAVAFYQRTASVRLCRVRMKRCVTMNDLCCKTGRRAVCCDLAMRDVSVRIFSKTVVQGLKEYRNVTGHSACCDGSMMCVDR